MRRRIKTKEIESSATCGGGEVEENGRQRETSGEGGMPLGVKKMGGEADAWAPQWGGWYKG
jgi:hypothetical protein